MVGLRFQETDIQNNRRKYWGKNKPKQFRANQIVADILYSTFFLELESRIPWKSIDFLSGPEFFPQKTALSIQNALFLKRTFV